ncbi:MAG: RidA family protein [Candidatus Binatia bacterium]
MAKTTLNPDGLPAPRGSYSLVNIAQPGRMVWIAGQTASDHDGKVVGVGDARAQTRFVLGKIQRAVEATGGTMNDVVVKNVTLIRPQIVAANRARQFVPIRVIEREEALRRRAFDTAGQPPYREAIL